MVGKGDMINKSYESIVISHHCTLKDAEQVLSMILDEGQDGRPDIDDQTTGELRALLNRIRAAIKEAETP
jgi:hypothetical protein